MITINPEQDNPEGKLNVAICFMIDNYFWSNDDKPLKKDYVMRGI